MTEAQQRMRGGNFTSSEIFALMSNDKTGKGLGAPAKTYIEEKNMERRLQRFLDSETGARPVTWGNLCEKRVLYELLGTEYQPLSTETMMHPQIGYWCGSPDGLKYDEGKTVIDVKSPFSLKSFCQLADCHTIEEVRAEHKDGDKYFWQLVSNAILTDSRYAELIIYCPYRSELKDIRELTTMIDGEDQNKYAWINWSQDSELPYLNDGGYYKNIHVIRWEVSDNDKQLLTGRVLQAGNLLQPRWEKELMKNNAA